MAQNKKKKIFVSNTKWFSVLLKILAAILVLLILICTVKTCRECDRSAIIDKTGYLPENEGWDNIPDVVPPYDDNDLDSLPGMVSLEAFFPPIGDQENKGTCVAWAVGYNLKTALNAIENHWTPEQLENADYQTSPKDLFLCISPNQKGTNCEGTCFEPAFAALMSDGVASMQAVPYKNLGGCNGTKTGNPANKIANFSRIVSESEKPRVEHIKAYLNDTVPLVFGAKLGDRFMSWSGGGVINSDTYLYSGMHASHAMVLSGYDDSKHAFRVRNSWGAAWGDEGSIWVDYDFFCNEMCYAVFVAQNPPEQSTAQNSVAQSQSIKNKSINN
jgi:C1A family cysteine protease